MRTSKRTARWAGVLMGLGLTISTSPAHAETYQHPACYFGELGSAKWRMSGDYDGIHAVWGLWEDRSGRIVTGPKTQYWHNGPVTIRVQGQGDDQWALFGIGFDDGDEAPHFQPIGGPRCSGGNRFVVDTLAGGGGFTPGGRGVVPPLVVSEALTDLVGVG